MGYEKKKLKDCCISISDGDHLPPPKALEGIPFITISNIDENSRISFDDVMHVPEAYYDGLAESKKAQKGDILYSVVGSFGKPVYIENFRKFVFQRHIAILKPNNEVNHRYLYYVMLNPIFYQIADKIAIGCSQRTVTLDALRNIDVLLPEKEVQDSIVNVLSRIDDKIAINNRINENLAAMAKTIYDYWFTQFDFPDENGKPYRSSGGQMVWNEQLKREIPVGWTVKPLSQIMRKKAKAFDYASTQPTVDLSIMPSNSIAISQLNSSDNFSTNLFEMKRGDILFGSIRPYLHKAGIAPCDGVVAGTVHSYEVLNDFDYNFALLTITRDIFFDYAVNVSSGTKMPVVSSEAILEYQVPYNKQIVRRFSQLALKDTITENALENQQLTQLRDWLLPMLMNGQATVSD